MVKKIKFFLVMLIYMVLLHGCAGIKPVPEEIHNISNLKEDKIFKIKQHDFDGKEIEKKEIISLLTDNILKSGKFNYYKKWPKNRNSLPNSVNLLEYNVSGVVVTIVDDGILVSYINGDMRDSGRFYVNMTSSWHNATEKWNIAKVDAVFPLKITKDGQFYTVKIGLPKKVDYRERLARVDPIGTKEEVANDLMSKFDNLRNPVLKNTKVVSDEIDTKYSSESTYANFERILGKYKFKQNDVKIDDIEKNNSFNYNHKEKSLCLNISVFPYRNGSKINYKLYLPYEVSSSYSIDDTEISQIKKNITMIAND